MSTLSITDSDIFDDLVKGGGERETAAARKEINAENDTKKLKHGLRHSSFTSSSN